MESDTTFMCGDFFDDNIMSLAGGNGGGGGDLGGDDEGLGGYGMEPFELPNMTVEEFDRMVYEALGTCAPEAEVQEPMNEEGPEPTEELELELTEEEEVKREEEALERERNARQLEEDIFNQRDEVQRLTAESRMADRIEVDPMNWDGNEMRPRQATSTGHVAGGASGTETVDPAEGDLAPNNTGDTIVAHPITEDVITTNAGGAEDSGAPNATGDSITVPTVDEDVITNNAGGAEDAGTPNATDGTAAVPPTGADAAPTNGSGTNTTAAEIPTDKKSLFYLMLEVHAQANRRAEKRARTEEPVTPSGSSGTKRRRVEAGDSANDARGAKNQAPVDRGPTQAAREGPSAPTTGSAGHGPRGGQSGSISPPLPSYDDSGVRPHHNASPRNNHGRNGNTAGYQPSASSGARPGGNMPPPHNHRREISTAGYRPNANSAARPTGNAPPPHNHGRDILRAGQRPRAAPIAGQSRFTGGSVMGHQRFTEIPISGSQQFVTVPIAGPLQRPVGPTGGTAPSHQGPIYRAGPPGTLSLVPDGGVVWGYLSTERLTCVIQLPHGFEGVSPTGRAGLLWRGYFDPRGDGQWRHHGSMHMTMGQNLRFLAGGRVEGQVNCGEAGAMRFLATTVRGGTMGQGYSAGEMRRQWAVMGPRGN